MLSTSGTRKAFLNIKRFSRNITTNAWKDSRRQNLPTRQPQPSPTRGRTRKQEQSLKDLQSSALETGRRLELSRRRQRVLQGNRAEGVALEARLS